MKLIKYIFAASAFFFAFTLANAQTSKKADDILKASKKKFEGVKDVTATFSYTLNNPNLAKPIVKKGNLFYKGDKYKVSFSDEEIYCNGQAVWIKLNADEEVTITDFDPEESMSISKIFNLYENGTKSKYEGEEDGSHKIILFANEDSGDIWKSEIWVNKSSKMIDRALLHARNGSTYAYKMGSVKLDNNLGDSMFSLDHNSLEDDGWIITDLRN